MYCIKCGVELADTEPKCPLCGTVPFHPDMDREEEAPLFPRERYPERRVRKPVLMGALTIVFLIPLLVVIVCDLQINGRMVWSGYAAGGLILGYGIFLLPGWFRRPDPVVFVSVDFTLVGLLLLYISWKTHGGWFLSFGFPVVGFLGLLTVAVVALLRYTRGGELYIFGGAVAALGAFVPVMELLMEITFQPIHFVGWSWYPLIGLGLMGGALIFLAICRPARETMSRKFFL